VLSGKFEQFTIRHALNGRFHGIGIWGYHQGAGIAMSRCGERNEGRYQPVAELRFFAAQGLPP
jgi:hypothetical protein